MKPARLRQQLTWIQVKCWIDFRREKGDEQVEMINAEGVRYDVPALCREYSN